MIFKTITTDLNGAINKIGIFNRSFADLKNAISVNGIGGLFNSISPAITSKDLSNIREYNRLVSIEGVSSQTAWYRTMLSSSKASQSLFDDEKNLIRTNNSLILSEEAVTQATNTMTLSAKAAALGMKALSIAGNIILFMAITKSIQLAVKAIDDYVHRLNNAKEALNETKSELESVNSEIGETTDKIKELEALDPSSLSITDKEDLQRLKDQNKELRIRQQYLEQQEKYDLQKVADLTKEKYGLKYNDSASREDIDAYKELYEKPSKQSKPASTYLTGASSNQATPYAAGLQNQDIMKGSDSLASLIAQYEYFEEQKKKAIQSKDVESIDKYNQKIEEIAQKLRDDRTELQGFSDDLSATGESSAELDDINSKLKLIDDTLLTKGQNLVNFINSDAIADDKEKLVELANSGKLTADVLSNKFSEVDQYLKNNGLTLEDLISIIRAHKEELANLANTETDFSFNPQTFSEQIDALSDLQSKYTEFHEAVNNGEEITFDFSDIEAMREKFGEVCQSFDDFERVLTTTGSTTDDIQKAFDTLATEFIYNSDVLDGLNSVTREQIVSQLELQGIVNASEVVTEEFASVMEEAKDNSIDLTNATYEEINGLIAEGTYSEDTINKLYAYAIQKQLANANALDTSADIANLEALCQQLVNVTEGINWFARAKSLQMQIENGATGDLINSQLATAKDNIRKLALEAANVGAKVSTAPKNVSGGGGSSKENDAKNPLDEILDYYQTCLDNGYISLEDWLGKSKDAIDGYYEQGKINADDYFNHLKDLAEHLKDVYDGVADTVSGVLDDATDALKDKMDALDDSKDAIESKYEAEITYWQKQKDNLQDEIDLIEKANEKRQNAIALQKAKINEEKAENNRTRLTYVEGNDSIAGQMVYLNDPTAVREAQEEVADAEYKIQLQKLNDTLDEYTKKIEIIEEQRDKEIDGIERQREALQKQIDKYEKYKQKWADVTTSLEDEYAKQYAAAVLGADWESQVLAGRTDILNKFAADYAAIQNNIRYYTAKSAETENVIPLGLQNLPTDLSLISEGISTPVNEILNGMGGITDASNSIDTSNVAAQASNISTGLQPACQSISDTTQKFQELSDKISNYSIPAIDSSNLAASFETVRSQFSEFTDEFQSLCEQLTSSWSAFISAMNGGASGSGNGDPLAGGLDNDINSYASLFDPLFDSMDNAQSTFTQKLTEWADTWSAAKDDISSIIGVGGGASSSETSNGESKGKSDKKSGEKSEGNSSDSGADSIVGAVEAGGQSIAASFEETWTPALVDMGNYINEWCQKVVEMFNEMADKAIRDAAAAIEAAKEAAKGLGGDVSGLSSAGAYTGHAFATGTTGLPNDEPNAIVSEYGQKETTILPDGRVIKTNSPTEMSLPKGSIVFNEEQTKKLEENGKKIKVAGNAYANGTVNTPDNIVTLEDGTVLIPIQPGDPIFDNIKKFEPFIEKWRNGEMGMLNNALFEHQKQMENMYKQLNAMNVVNNNKNVQPVTIQFGDIHLTGVQDVDAFANAINTRMSSAMMQSLYRR